MPLIQSLFLLTVAASADRKWWTPGDLAAFQKELAQKAASLDAAGRPAPTC